MITSPQENRTAPKTMLARTIATIVKKSLTLISRSCQGFSERLQKRKRIVKPLTASPVNEGESGFEPEVTVFYGEPFTKS